MRGGGGEVWIRPEMEAVPGKKKSRAAAFRARLFSTLLMWGLVMMAFTSGRLSFLVALVAGLGLLGAVEFYRLTRETPGRECRTWALVVSVAYLLVLSWSFMDPEGRLAPLADGFSLEMAGLVLVVLGAFTLRLRHEVTGPESVYPVSMASFAYVYVPVLFVGFTIRLAYVPDELASPAAGLWLVLMVVLTTKFTDMGAYLVGSLIGKHKAIPHLSPAKSWEGYVGSLFFAQAGAFGVYYFGGEHFDWLGSGVHVFVLGVLLALAAMVGDLAESILKRSLRVKDSGQLLPGIGGVLDLLDSLCFAVPLAYYYLVLFVV